MTANIKLSASVLKLTTLAEQLSNRFERLGVDETGVMDPDDKKLLDKVRAQIETVRAEPLKKLLRAK